MGSIRKRTNIVVSRNIGAPGSHETVVSAQHAPIAQDGTSRRPDEAALSPEELEAQHADDLPDREAMSLISGVLPPTVAPFEPGALPVDRTLPPA